MMINYVTSSSVKQHEAALDRMFRDRKRVFVDMLKWNVPVDGPYERDQFDDEYAEYIIMCEPVSGRHLGSLRILRTDRPHILGDLFHMLCEGEVPTGPEIRELTRLCLSPDLRAVDRLKVRNRLFTTAVEYALLNGIRGYTGVAAMAWYSQLLSLGWRCTPLGFPRLVEGAQVAALIAHIEHDTINLFREAGTYNSGDIQISYDLRRAA